MHRLQTLPSKFSLSRGEGGTSPEIINLVSQVEIEDVAAYTKKETE